MNFVKAIVAAGLVAASTSAFAADITGAGSTFIFPVLSKWADAYKKETGNGVNYQSIGSGARHQADPGQDRDLRRDRRAAEGRAAREGRLRAVADDHGRDRSGREHRRRQGRRPGARRRDPRQHLSRQDHQVGRSGDQEAQPEASSCRPPRSRSCTVPTARARPSTSPTICPRSSADWKSKVGSGTAVEWPVGVGAKGNEGVSGQYRPDQELDRLCRICLRQAEQADLHRAGQQGRQDRAADHRSLPGRRFQRRLGATRRATT